MNDFISAIKLRLNKGIALRALLISLIIAAAIALVWGLSYIIRGHAVYAAMVYPIAGGVAFVSAIFIWLRKRKNVLQASAYADQFFQLKDSLTSAVEFEAAHKEGQIYELQKNQAAKTIADLSPESIPLPVSRKLTSLALLGVIAAGSLAFIPPSQKVLDEIQEKATTSERTEEIKKLVEEEVENMINSLSDHEKEAIDPDAIRQWVKELKQTDDKREALRNIARVEQKIQKSIDALQNRKNEEMLKNAGLKMLKAQDAATKEMGKHLENKDFKKAAEKLEEYKLRKEDKKDKAKKLDPKKLAKLKEDAKNPDKKKALNEHQKKLAKLRELTKRLSQAAKQNKAQASPNSSGSPSMSMEQFAEMLEQHGINKLPQDLTLEDLKNLPEALRNKLPMELLDQLPEDMLMQLPPELLEKLLELLESNAQDLQEMMEEMELEMMEGEQMTEEEWEELLEMLENMDGDLEALKKMLQRMQAMKSMRGRLKGLKKGLGLAQGFANGQKSQSQFRMQMKGKGGKEPGTGSDSSRRKAKEKLENNKQYSKLKGQKGVGPSQSSIEDADSGTGSSSKKGTAKERSFEHQMSSFIERDDVPEEMKQSVKQYFEDIHNIAPATPSKKEK